MILSHEEFLKGFDLDSDLTFNRAIKRRLAALEGGHRYWVILPPLENNEHFQSYTDKQTWVAARGGCIWSPLHFGLPTFEDALEFALTWG